LKSVEKNIKKSKHSEEDESKEEVVEVEKIDL